MPAEIEIPFYFSMKGLASEKPAFLSKQLSRLCVRVSLFKKMKKFAACPIVQSSAKKQKPHNIDLQFSKRE